ncbi:hypothetical protein [Actinoallomurus sp. CA-150999]|uniref:hypothetical protein n=1 Tax=Actinoallomurus sp. CA-150999 TaxID=3239887 RepID=UPI003D8F2EED
MRAVLRTSPEELMEDYSRRVEQPKDMRRALDKVSATVTCREDQMKIITDLQAMVENHEQAEHTWTIHGHTSTMRV